MMKRLEASWERSCLGLVVVAAIAYVVVLSILTIGRWQAYRAGLFDLGAFEQLFWNTLHGRPFQNTIDPVAPNYLGNHFSPGLLLMIVPYAVVPRTETMLVVQSLLLGAAAIPIFLLARDILRSPGLGVVVSITYLLYPALHGANVFEVHETALVPLLVATTLLFLRREPGGLGFLLSLGLLVLAKDEMVFFAIVLGGAVAVFMRRRRLGVGIVLASVVWAVLIFGVFMPRLGNPEVQAARFAVRYAPVGETPAEVARAPVERPRTVASTLGQPEKRAYYHELLMPLGYLPVLGGWYPLLAAPHLLVNALTTNYPAQVDVSYQYSAPLAGILPLAAARGMAVLIPSRPGRPRRIVIGALAVWLLGTAITSTLAYGLPSGRETFEDATIRRDPTAAAIDRFQDLVPPMAALSADNLLGSHFARRPHIVEFPDSSDADWVLATTDRNRISRSHGAPEDYLRRLAELLEDPGWQVVHEEAGVVLLRAVEPGPEPDPGTDIPMRLALTLLTAALVATVLSRHSLSGERS